MSFSDGFLAASNPSEDCKSYKPIVQVHEKRATIKYSTCTRCNVQVGKSCTHSVPYFIALLLLFLLLLGWSPQLNGDFHYKVYVFAT